MRSFVKLCVKCAKGEHVRLSRVFPKRFRFFAFTGMSGGIWRPFEKQNKPELTKYPTNILSKQQQKQNSSN